MNNLLILILALASSSLFSQTKTGTIVPLSAHDSRIMIEVNNITDYTDSIGIADLSTPYVELRYKYKDHIPNFENLSDKDQVTFVYEMYVEEFLKNAPEWWEFPEAAVAPTCADSCLRDWELRKTLLAIEHFEFTAEELGFKACESLGQYSEFEVIISQPLNRFGVSFTVLYPTTPTTGPGSNFQRTHVVIGANRQIPLGTIVINTEK